MNDTLTDILMNACVTPVAMPTRLLMEHVLLVSILHHNIGIEVILVLGTNLVSKYILESVFLDILFELPCNF